MPWLASTRPRLEEERMGKFDGEVVLITGETLAVAAGSNAKNAG